MKEFFNYFKQSYRNGWYFFYAFMIGYASYAFIMGQWQVGFLVLPAMFLAAFGDYKLKLYNSEVKK